MVLGPLQSKPDTTERYTRPPASATQLAIGLGFCDQVLSNTKVKRTDGVEFIQYLRTQRPTLPIIYLANTSRSTPEIEASIPADVPTLREPFTVETLRNTVEAMLDGKAK